MEELQIGHGSIERLDNIDIEDKIIIESTSFMVKNLAVYYMRQIVPSREDQDLNKPLSWIASLSNMRPFFGIEFWIGPPSGVYSNRHCMQNMLK